MKIVVDCCALNTLGHHAFDSNPAILFGETFDAIATFKITFDVMSQSR
ncbi:hypothetical protein [Acaryochloris thomasi]|nr:hypothetical protein [Acaryochloris thomasi]